MADKKIDLSHFDTAKQSYDLSVFEPKEMGQLESLVRGGEQGLAFGFGDEINAAVESALSDKKYVDALKESRDAFAAAEQTNPMTYGAGELGGALGSLALPGIGAIGRVGKGATLLERAIGGAKAGAAIGGVTKLGTSEDKLSAATAKDVIEGMGTGLVAGGAITGTLPLIGKTLDKGASSLEYYKNLKRAYQAAREGESLIGKTEPLKEKIRGVAKKDIIEGLTEAQQEVGSKLGQVRRTGVPTDVSEIIPKMEEELGSMYAPGEAKQGVGKVKDIISSLGKETGVTPELNQTRASLNELMGDTYGASGIADTIAPRPASRNVLDTTIKELQKIAYDETRTATERKAAGNMAQKLIGAAEAGQPEALKPHIANLNKLFTGGLEAEAKLGIGPGVTGTTREARAAGESAVDSLSNMIEQFSDKSSNARQKIKEAMDALRKQAEVDPDSGKKLQDLYSLTKTTNPDALLNKIEGLSRDYKVAKQLTAQSSIDKSGNIIAGSVLQLSGKAIPMLAADVTGRTVALPGQIGSKVVGMVSDLSKASPEMLQSIGQRLSNKASPYTQQFQKILTQPDSLRKAMLFTLMQQPGFRSDIEDKGTP